MANRLQYSDSPYLLQHKDNPVDWYEWSNEAFEKAKAENKLIFLSIGYSTCHWCHVMERESFKNQKIADILNKYYVSIKVDREEKPDIDKKYQKIYQIMHNRPGGWPLTIIMTPKKEVFYSATYLPPHYSQYGPGLEEILVAIANDWNQNPSKIEKIANNLKEFLTKKSIKKVEIKDSVIEDIINETKEVFDTTNGGMKGAPKFPMESTLDLLIDVYLLNKDKAILDILNTTLEKMAKGGIFDQIEGGFYRYSTDSKWEIPHFEKMLYNNANLPFVYLRMYEITNNELFKEVSFRSFDEMFNRYRDENGLFFSASNADSDGKEGAYFVYTYDEVEREFNQFENKEELLNYFGIQKYGNFNGKNNPTINSNRPKNYQKALKILKQIRKSKTFPFIDTKKMTSWNAMMIKALLKAGCFEKRYKIEAFKTLDKLIEKMFVGNKLYHSYNKNESAKTDAFLEDYAYLISNLIDAYEFSFDKKYLDLAKELIIQTKEKFYNNEWYMNITKDIEADFSDSAYSSSLSILAQNFLRLAVLFYDLKFQNEANEILEFASQKINDYPLYYPSITKAYLMKKFGVYILSMNETKCINLEYPYIELKKGESYELCTIEKCLVKTNNIDEIKKFLG